MKKSDETPSESEILNLRYHNQNHSNQIVSARYVGIYCHRSWSVESDVVPWSHENRKNIICQMDTFPNRIRA